MEIKTKCLYIGTNTSLAMQTPSKDYFDIDTFFYRMCDVCHKSDGKIAFQKNGLKGHFHCIFPHKRDGEFDTITFSIYLDAFEQKIKTDIGGYSPHQHEACDICGQVRKEVGLLEHPYQNQVVLAHFDCVPCTVCNTAIGGMLLRNGMHVECQYGTDDVKKKELDQQIVLAMDNVNTGKGTLDQALSLCRQRFGPSFHF